MRTHVLDAPFVRMFYDMPVFAKDNYLAVVSPNDQVLADAIVPFDTTDERATDDWLASWFEGQLQQDVQPVYHVTKDPHMVEIHHVDETLPLADGKHARFIYNYAIVNGHKWVVDIVADEDGNKRWETSVLI